MCGIAGVIARSPDMVLSALRAMTEAQCHRGPDDSGQRVVEGGDACLGFGHRRLSIIDLSPLGHQPMAHPETGDIIVFNGELYNYMTFRKELEREGVVFRGHSDTEVMLHALTMWGPSVIARFEGMYAFAFFRRKDRKMILCRDHTGIKPLYYSWSRNAFCFASEVRSILASGMVDRTISPRGLATVLAYGAVQEPDTFFDEVKMFPAGCWQEIELDGVLSLPPSPPRRFWSPPQVDASITYQEAVDRTRSILDDAVRDHLLADVEVGVFLSGGIDSTITAGLAGKHQKGIRAYTVGFSDEPDLSESDLASTTAKAFGLPHVDVQITTPDALAAVGRWLSQMDQPSMDGLNTYVVSQAVRETGLKVALSGLGGDELFCGYSSFEDVPRLLRIMRRVKHLPKPMRTLIARGVSVGKSDAYRQKLVEIARTRGHLVELYFQRRRTLSNAQLASLGIEPELLGLGDMLMPPDALLDLNLDDRDPVAGVSILESRYYTGNMLLRDSDACGMAHSLEIRVPFFDKRLMDGIMAIPGHIRMPRGVANKQLLRSAFPEFLRPELLALKKRGFTLPIRRWMATSLRSFCEASLADLKTCGLLDPRGVNAVWRSFVEQPESQVWSRAFTLCVLGSYISRNKAAVSPSRAAFASTPAAPALRLRSVSVA